MIVKEKTENSAKFLAVASSRTAGKRCQEPFPNPVLEPVKGDSKDRRGVRNRFGALAIL
jgi:hypothetical protein